MATALGIGARILPATDDRFRTMLETDEGPLDFQDYFVRRRQEPEVTAVTFDGAATARPTPAVLDAIAGADLVVIGPSNPIVSIGPILALAGVREALRDARLRRSRSARSSRDARSRARPTGCSSALATSRPPSAWPGSTPAWSTASSSTPPMPHWRADIEALGMAVGVLDTVMRDDDDRRALAASLLAELPGGERDRRDR